jgi:hypothetical protein
MSEAATLLSAVRASFSDVLDYAGLFPPARLELDPAIRNFARHRNTPDAWLLSRFVCPVARLAGLGPHYAALFEERALSVSGLGRGGESAAEFLSHTREDAATLRDFNARSGGWARVDAFEVRLPAGITESAGVRRLLDDAASVLLAGAPADELPIFVEVALDGDWRASLQAAVDGVVEHNAAQADRRVGLKLRCGGLEPAAVPSVEQVAGVIAACRDGETPLKFTAGLHHALRSFRPEFGGTMHGFVNVFAAGILACVRDIDEQTIRLVVAEEHPEAFRFDDARFAWRGFTVAAEEIEQARIGAVTSFGSCSFDEPRDELRALGWI